MLVHFNYSHLISIENLFQAWYEFRKDKKKRADVQLFERNLEDNLFELHQRLKTKIYRHGEYHSFYVQDPKQRHIHKAEVRDRIVHHLLYKYLYKQFDKTFIYDSYSCRLEKGIHRAVKRLEKFARIVSKNYTKPCWALKLDIKKFFASVDHQILKNLLRRKVVDQDILWLLDQVINSFLSGSRVSPLRSELSGSKTCEAKGIPLGNLTSQVFANIYMSEVDQFVKHTLRVKYYLRYADDFLILSSRFNDLNHLIKPVGLFLRKKLRLELHQKKIILRRLDWGIDFLGYIVLPRYILPRTKTKRRIFKKLRDKIDSDKFNQSLQSYLGYLGHANSFRLTQQLKNQVWFWSSK